MAGSDQGESPAAALNTEASADAVFMPEVSQERLLAMNDTQKGFVLSIRSLESTEELQGESLKRSVADMFPPAVLFGDALLNMPVIYKSLCDFLDSRGVNLQQHSSRRIMLTLASDSYEVPEDTEAALEIFTTLVAAGRGVRRAEQDLVTQAPSTTIDYRSHSSPSLDTFAHNVAMRLKEKDKNFSGSLE